MEKFSPVVGGPQNDRCFCQSQSDKAQIAADHQVLRDKACGKVKLGRLALDVLERALSELVDQPYIAKKIKLLETLCVDGSSFAALEAVSASLLINELAEESFALGLELVSQFPELGERLACIASDMRKDAQKVWLVSQGRSSFAERALCCELVQSYRDLVDKVCRQM